MTIIINIFFFLIDVNVAMESHTPQTLKHTSHLFQMLLYMQDVFSKDSDAVRFLIIYGPVHEILVLIASVSSEGVCTCADPENSIRGVLTMFFFIVFFVIDVFHRSPYGPPSRSIWI